MNYCNKFARMLIIGVLSCVGFSHYAATVPKSPTIGATAAMSAR